MRTNLTVREYDKLVSQYEKTEDTNLLKILQNCKILTTNKRR